MGLSTDTVRFDDYMRNCLYGSDGFYTSGRGGAGRRRDFITSPEVGPLFGAVLANWLDQQWDGLGQPGKFRVIDLGAGPGTLQKSLELAAPRCSAVWELISADLANQSVDLPEDLSGSVIIANELLDNMPFRIWRHGDAWDELVVNAGTEPSVGWQDPNDVSYALRYASSDDIQEYGRLMAFPVLDAASQLVDHVMDRGAERMLAFDYGLEKTQDLMRWQDKPGKPWGGWLRTYRDHVRGSDPLFQPGRWDITTDIAVDQFRPVESLRTQSKFLADHGIGDLVAEGKDYWAEHAADPNLKAIMMRSRVSEAESLTHSEGLGSWLVLEFSSNSLDPLPPAISAF